MVSLTRQALGSDKSLFAQMAEVARPGVGGLVVVPAQDTGRHHAEGADCRQRPRLGAAQGVWTFAVVPHEFAFLSPRQVEIAHEDIAGIDVSRIAFPLRPSLIIAVTRIAIGRLVAIEARIPAELTCLTVSIALILVLRVVREVGGSVVVTTPKSRR